MLADLDFFAGAAQGQGSGILDDRLQFKNLLTQAIVVGKKHETLH